MFFMRVPPIKFLIEWILDWMIDYKCILIGLLIEVFFGEAKNFQQTPIF